MSDPGPGADLLAEVEKRKTWFYECQVRGLNLDAFRGITEASQDARLDLISERPNAWDPLGHPLGGRFVTPGPVYLDSQEPVWDADEGIRRGAFDAKFIGRRNNWMGYHDGRRLAEKLGELRRKYEAAPYASQLDLHREVNQYKRLQPSNEHLGAALARAALASHKPWLIPELYNAKAADTQSIEGWIDNLQAFVANFEAELVIAVGAIPGTEVPFGPGDPAEHYRQWLRFLLQAQLTRDVADALEVEMLVQVPDPNDSKARLYRYDTRVRIAGQEWMPLTEFKRSDSVKYWAAAMKGALGEVYVNKPNADMGLCHVIRAIYLHGALPTTLGSDADLTWRTRAGPDQRFAEFMQKKADDPKLARDAALRERFTQARTKLQVILEETTGNPRYPSALFSPLAQQIARHTIHAFKFWLDEPLRCSSNAALVKARKDTGIVTNEKEQVAEMEYWSENHYIMFASSEYLAGQLWANDEFQPAKEFLKRASTDGILTGEQRKDRGKARVLKYLNNRLQFGWTEFNSSGYYREHLWSLLNLADFALDQEVRTKATIVTDLLLFDVARFQHRGAMGAAGGRCQFKSKASGFDSAVTDVVEILFGVHGLFTDADSEVGSAYATSTYRVPEVLLQVGSHPPPDDVDRSRVSITFEEAPKYGISYSKKSDQKDSYLQGYASKRARYYPFLGAVNKELERTHTKYAATEDDTIFWWGASAFYNKQIVRQTMKTVEAFGLADSPIFKGAVPLIIRIVSYLERLKHGFIGGLIGLPIGGVLGAGVGALAGAFESEIFDSDTLEDASDDLSVLLEGSTRTRANILTYRTPDVMLSSAQNFRAGQLNFQSSVCQAAIHPGLNVFTTAGFADLDLSDLEMGLLGGLLGGAVAPVGFALGAAAGVIANEAFLSNEDILVEHEDGPGWWSGSWALPMVAQWKSAAILAYDFHTIQSTLADCGTHAWFPKAGFEHVEQQRTSAYDDANFALLDIGDIGPKGFWLFGKVTHPKEDPSDDPREAYVGVFSNQRPEWLNKDSDFYEEQLRKVTTKAIDDVEDKIDDALDKLEGDDFGDIAEAIRDAVARAVSVTYQEGAAADAWKAAASVVLGGMTDILVQARLASARSLAQLEVDRRTLRRVWAEPLTGDYFADRDWYASGKNVWIIQVGSRAEFGDYDTFKQRVSRARIHMDDAGDLECSYDIPKADGSSDRLTLAYGDGGEFQLNGAGFQTDLYPRFENCFVRGRRVEWGQREYVLEWNGKSLLHDFSDFFNPVRTDSPQAGADDADTVRALVVYIRTGDEAMDAFTVATATVSIGCSVVTRDQVVACGPADEDQVHDAEWVFFDFAATLDPDMSLTFTHPGSTDGDDTPSWKMSFGLKALTGDRSLIDCALSFSSFSFEDNRRTSIAFPFSVPLKRWRPWQKIDRSMPPLHWTIAAQAPHDVAHFDYKDLLIVDAQYALWHRRLKPCLAAETAWFKVTDAPGAAPDFSRAFSIAALTPAPGELYVFVVSADGLFVAWPSASGAWTNPWHLEAPYVYPDGLFGAPDTSAPAIPIALDATTRVVTTFSPGIPGRIDLYLSGADGHFYSHSGWPAAGAGPWRRIDVQGFTVARNADAR